MKKLFVVIAAVALFASANVSAQGKWGADSAECIKYMSYYKEYFKQKSYDEATPNWRQAYTLCPATSSQNMLIEGATLVKRLIAKNQKDPVYKAALIDTLMTLYDKRAEAFPKNAVTALNNKGIDMANYLKDDNARLYKDFSAIIAANKEQTRPQIFLFNLNAAVSLYQAGELGAEEVIDVYQNSLALIESIDSKSDAEAEQIAKIKSDMGSIFAGSKVASCNNLIDLFTPRFNENPQDAKLASNIVKTMNFADDCANNDLYMRAVTVMYNNEPSAKAAYALYKMHSNKGNVQDAIKFMEEAIAHQDSDAKEDAGYNYELAKFCFSNGLNSKAYECAKNVIDLDESQAGKAYFLIGSIWAATRCGGDEITSKAPFWVAVDYYNKAKAADPSLAEEANRFIGRYSAYFPDTADAFMYNLQKGQSFTAVCGGMTASTTVKTK
ncbi:MAG: hypothetical protein MJY91_08595 [Bacteroidales bacterium]|nr:hypothetical protein [Bacteroidales bacterium]